MQLSGSGLDAGAVAEEALLLQRVGDLLGHVALVVAGQHLRGDEDPVLEPAGGDHPLALAEEVRQDAGRR